MTQIIPVNRNLKRQKYKTDVPIRLILADQQAKYKDLWRKINKWNVDKKDKSRSGGIIWRTRHSHSHKITRAPIAGACRKNSGRLITEDGEAGNNWWQEKERKAEIEMEE